jgi:hypothetical protein
MPYPDSPPKLSEKMSNHLSNGVGGWEGGMNYEEKLKIKNVFPKMSFCLMHLILMHNKSKHNTGKSKGTGKVVPVLNQYHTLKTYQLL